jgi:hypothetical protein
VHAQVVLQADGPGNTYELINSVFALPNRNVVEVPDCNHNEFGRHIDEVFDAELNTHVFQFHLHVSPDNDRCKAGVNDRQRNEIKTYGSSPENIKAAEGETVVYKWKFKLGANFKPSSSFTHIHQIKSVGGPYQSIPMVSFTLRKSNPDRLELRHTSTTNQTTLKTANLDLFRGVWVSVEEKITFSNTGSYALEIKNIATNQIIFSYTNNAIDNWQDGADFARPKWGIYRSLNNVQDLQDEVVKFADFSIQEVQNTLSLVTNLKEKAANILLYPNPSSNKVTFSNTNSINYTTIKMYNYSGKEIHIKDRLNTNKLDVSGFAKGLYFIVFKKGTTIVKVLKCYVK